MFPDSLNIDVQIHQEEVKKPSDSSIVLVPLKHNSGVVHQLELNVSNLDVGITAKNIDSASQNIFNEWQSIFPLYTIQRAFADTFEVGTVVIYVTFDATNIFSNTQLRNIKKTISELFEVEFIKVLDTMKEKQLKQETVSSNRKSFVSPDNFSRESIERDNSDMVETLKQLRQENSELQVVLQKKQQNDKSQAEMVGDLRLELGRKQHSFSGFNNETTDRNVLYENTQKTLEQTSNKLSQTQQDLMDKQREIQRLQSLVTENERYINSLQSDYDKLAEASDFQLQHTLEENDVLKTEVETYKTNELKEKQNIQRVKSELGQLILETENAQEQLRQNVQRLQYENEELRTVIQENQQFEERIHQELLEATKDLTTVRENYKQLETGKNLLDQEWTTRFNSLSIENDELSMSYKASLEMEAVRNTELIELKSKLIHLEQEIQKNNLDKQQLETDFQSRFLAEEREKERLIKQITVDKEQFVSNKEQEIKRLSERLMQQKQLVDKLMLNQSDTTSVWQESTDELEKNYHKTTQRITELELEVLTLTEKNSLLMSELASKEATKDIELTKELDLLPKEVTKELEEVKVTNDDAYYDYAEEDSDYEYDYDEYEDDDDDYEYHEVDELVSYNPETIEEDVDDLLDNKDEDGKEKISKKDFKVYQMYIDQLPNLVEQADEEAFKKFVEPKMKKFKKFKREFEEDVKSPSLFSRKYKMEAGLANQMKAYVLMSRHLSILLDIVVSEDAEYEYDYEYDEDYED